MKKNDWIALTIIFVIIFILLKLTWLKWFDFLVDFGRELYIPWQITKGKVLYKDIAFHNGPLSNYINALIFKIFGVGLINIIWFNICLLLVFNFLLYKLLRMFLDITTSFLIIVYLIFVHYFQFYLLIGNYNFIAPYSHELLHGFYLTIILFFLVSLSRDFSISLYLKIGIILGLIFLTKIEIFTANILAFLLIFILVNKYQKKDFKDVIKNLMAVFIAGGGIILFSTLFFKMVGLNIGDYFESLIRAYKVAGDMNKNIFYFKRMGLDNLEENLFFSFTSFFFLLFYFIFIFLISLALKYLKINHLKNIVFIIILLFIVYLSYNFSDFPVLARVGGAYNIISVIGCILAFFLVKNNFNIKKNLLFLYFSILSVLFLIRMFFSPTIYHYGFLTTVPSSIVFMVISMKFVEYIGKRFGVLKELKFFYIFSVLSFVIAVTVKISFYNYNLKTVFLDRGKDSFYVYNSNHTFGERDRILIESLSYIEKNFKKDETFISFPDGIILNYLAKIDNPSPYYYFVPTDFTLWGEENMLLAIKNNLPSYVLLNNHPTEEFGKKGIGIDYGIVLWNFLKARYLPIVQFGNSNDFHIILAKKLF